MGGFCKEEKKQRAEHCAKQARDTVVVVMKRKRQRQQRAGKNWLRRISRPALSGPGCIC